MIRTVLGGISTFVILGVVGLTSATTQQIELSTRDSAEIRVTVLQVVLDSISSPRTDSTRLWIKAPRRYDRETGIYHEIEFSSLEWSTIKEHFPTAALVQADDTLFLCPPGLGVRIPLSSCPVRESGLIVHFGEIVLEVDGRVETSGQLMQTTDGYSEAAGRGMRLARSATGGWELVEILWLSIT